MHDIIIQTYPTALKNIYIYTSSKCLLLIPDYTLKKCH